MFRQSKVIADPYSIVGLGFDSSKTPSEVYILDNRGTQFTVAVDEFASDLVNVHGAQTISGDKTFSGAVSLASPTDDSHAAHKSYVDNLHSAGSGLDLSSGKEFSVALGGITNSMLSPSCVDSSKCLTSTSAGVMTIADTQVVTGEKTFDVVSVSAPTSALHATTKSYVDSLYTAGGGLEVSASQVFSVSGLGISNAMLALSCVDSTKCVTSGSAGVCTLGEAQVLSGAKTFSSSCSVSAPTSDAHAATKLYVDSLYTATGGLQLSASKAFSVSNQGISNAMLANSSVTSGKCVTQGSSGVFTLADEQTVTAAKTFSSTLTVLAPTSDYHASTKKYVDDKYVAGNGLSFSTSNQVDTFFIDAGGVGTDELASEAVTAAKVRTSGTSGIMTLGAIQDVYGVKTFKEDANFEGAVAVSNTLSCSKSSGTGLSVTSNTELKGDVEIKGSLKFETSGLGGTGYVGFQGSSQVADMKMFTFPGLLDTTNQSTLRFYETVSGAANTYFAHPVYKRFVKSSDQFVTANTIVSFGTEYGSTTTIIQKNSSDKFVFQPHRTYKIDISLLMYVPFSNLGLARISVGWTNAYTAGTGTPTDGQVITFINPDRQSSASVSNSTITLSGENRYYNGTISTVLTTGSSSETWWLQGMSTSLAGCQLIGENFSQASSSSLYTGGSQITILAL